MASHDQDGNRDGRNGNMGEGGGRVSFMWVPMRSNTAGPGKTVAFTYQPINMKIFQQERRNALPPLLDPNSIVGRVSAFLFPSPQNWPRIFRILAPTTTAALRSQCTVIIAAAAEATFSSKQREGGSSFAVWIGVELSLCLSRSCRPPPSTRQSSFPCPFCR